MDEQHALPLRRKDTTRGPALRILSLDGGGVRGYSMLIILQELMHRTFVEIEGRAPKRHEIPRPCEHFDLIVGTGTGGLIALMLGRLRLDVDTCKDVYVRMTRRVFETDKTFAGIPYRGTLFKASKLEEAIKECVRQHTIDGDEGNDRIATAEPMYPDTPTSQWSSSSGGTATLPAVPMRSTSIASRYSQVGMSPIAPRFGRLGDPDTRLYDLRENRTKTAVTAVYRGSQRGAPPALLRSYDSRKEPAPEVHCSVWQAGRATCATGLAFKPIQIGQSVFIDEGTGKYNPAPMALDEALLNEWPGREVGVFLSIGTGKRPPGTNTQQHLWWESFVGGAPGGFAEARRRLISKIEGCEETHQYMLKEHLPKRRVPVENYYRLNVEVGVGEFGMNEWNRLSDISSNTRMYLSKHDVTAKNMDAAVKLAKVHFAKRRHDRHLSDSSMQAGDEVYDRPHSFEESWYQEPRATELPAADVVPRLHPVNLPPRAQQQQYMQRSPSLADAKFTVIAEDPPQPMDSPHQRMHSDPPRRPPPLSSASARSSLDQQQSPRHAPPPPPPPPLAQQHALPGPASPPPRQSPPPIPPKTPLPYPDADPAATRVYGMGSPTRAMGVQHAVNPMLPYPESDGPPPVVNMARKPEFGSR